MFSVLHAGPRIGHFWNFMDLAARIFRVVLFSPEMYVNRFFILLSAFFLQPLTLSVRQGLAFTQYSTSTVLPHGPGVLHERNVCVPAPDTFFPQMKCDWKMIYFPRRLLHVAEAKPGFSISHRMARMAAGLGRR